MTARNEGAVGDARKRGQGEQAPAATLTEGERALIEGAFDDRPAAGPDYVITRKEWRQLFAVVERILAARQAPADDALAEAWDEGFERAEYMARCWGHTDNWFEEDPYPTNPYRAARPSDAGEGERQSVDCYDGEHRSCRGVCFCWCHASPDGADQDGGRA